MVMAYVIAQLCCVFLFCHLLRFFQHVDDVMAVYGKDVIKGVKFILVADHPGPRIKEQVGFYCI